jgi:hypothetical protein
MGGADLVDIFGGVDVIRHANSSREATLASSITANERTI